MSKEEKKPVYRKPRMVAKSPAKKSYVAGCPSWTEPEAGCGTFVRCEIQRVQ